MPSGDIDTESVCLLPPRHGDENACILMALKLLCMYINILMKSLHFFMYVAVQFQPSQFTVNNTLSRVESKVILLKHC